MKEIRKIITGADASYERHYTVDEYVRHEIISNRANHSLAFKGDLFALAQERKIKNINRMQKGELYDALIADGMEPRWFAKKYGVGVPSLYYQRAFDITHKQVKKAEKEGLLTVSGTRDFYGWGKGRTVPVYDAYQFVSMKKWVGETKIENQSKKEQRS